MSERCGYFVTGTDTGVGKTVVTLGLMQALQQRGRVVAAMKPVAAGCELTPGGLRSADAQLLAQQASVERDYELINPYAFAPAIAPHLAAELAGVTIEIDKIISNYNYLSKTVDCVLVEGVGGWQVPLNHDQTLADMARLLGMEVILVVAIRLGCLNHALLTAAAVTAAGCTLAGWVANRFRCAPEYAQQNINALKSRITAPLLGVLPEYQVLNVSEVAANLSLPPLTQG